MRALLLLPLLLGAADAPLPSALEAGWQGRDVCELLFDNAHVRALRCTFPPGIGHERHFHPRHWGYVELGGMMRITSSSGTTERLLASGSNWWSDGVVWHEAVNIGDTTAVYVMVEPKAR